MVSAMTSPPMAAEPRFTHAEVVAATGASPTSTPRAPFEGVSTDSRTLVPGQLFVALRGERFDAHGFLADVVARGAAGAVTQTQHPRAAVPAGFPLYEVPDTLQALGGLGRFHRRRFTLPLGAVGGSNGKTTAKEMVGAILAVRGPALKTEGNLNNEVGLPLTLLRLRPEHVAAVVELGMNHPGEMSRLTAVAEPDAALITTVQPEHLEGLGSIEGVGSAPQLRTRRGRRGPARGVQPARQERPLPGHRDRWAAVAGLARLRRRAQRAQRDRRLRSRHRARLPARGVRAGPGGGAAVRAAAERRRDGSRLDGGGRLLQRQ